MNKTDKSCEFLDEKGDGILRCKRKGINALSREYLGCYNCEHFNEVDG